MIAQCPWCLRRRREIYGSYLGDWDSKAVGSPKKNTCAPEKCLGKSVAYINVALILSWPVKFRSDSVMDCEFPVPDTFCHQESWVSQPVGDGHEAVANRGYAFGVCGVGAGC